MPELERVARHSREVPEQGHSSTTASGGLRGDRPRAARPAPAGRSRRPRRARRGRSAPSRAGRGQASRRAPTPAGRRPRRSTPPPAGGCQPVRRISSATGRPRRRRRARPRPAADSGRRSMRSAAGLETRSPTGAVAAGGARGHLVGAVGRDHAHLAGLDMAGEQPQNVDRGRVGPVDVLDHEHDRRLPAGVRRAAIAPASGGRTRLRVRCRRSRPPRPARAPARAGSAPRAARRPRPGSPARRAPPRPAPARAMTCPLLPHRRSGASAPALARPLSTSASSAASSASRSSSRSISRRV